MQWRDYTGGINFNHFPSPQHPGTGWEMVLSTAKQAEAGGKNQLK